jgi:hypothetical protein
LKRLRSSIGQLISEVMNREEPKGPCDPLLYSRFFSKYSGTCFYLNKESAAEPRSHYIGYQMNCRVCGVVQISTGPFTVR